MLAGLVARVKKLRTKLMVGDLRRTEVVFVVVDGELLWRERGLACFIGMRLRSKLTKRR